MPTPRFPLELLFAIISHLGEDKDYTSLCACASTCKALISASQAHIFHTLTLLRESPAWLARLESTPHIRTFIKHLLLVEMHKPWIQRSKVLHRTLGLLSPYVVSLDIRHGRRKVENTRFDFSSLSQLKYVEEITLTEREPQGHGPGRIMHGDNTLPTFLNHFPNLRAITFDQCWVWVQTLDRKCDVADPVFRLERLHVNTCYDSLVLDWLAPALSSLKSLYLRYLGPDASIFSTTAPPRFESLQHLKVRGINWVSNTELRSLMTALHTTNIHSISLMTYLNSELSSVEATVKCLLLIGAHAHLQQLTIGFFQEDDPVDGISWDDLQDLLLGARFPALRSVELLFWLNPWGPNHVATWPFVAAVSRLSQKMKISVCYGG